MLGWGRCVDVPVEVEVSDIGGSTRAWGARMGNLDCGPWGLRVLGWEGIPVRIVVLGCGSPGRV